MFVLDIKTLTKKEVPDSYYECSVCGEFHPVEEFKNEDEQHRSRTNCSSCYNMKGMDLLSIKIDMLKKSSAYRQAMSQLKNEQAFFEGSMLASDLVEALSKLPKDARVFVGQNGYYADGKFAECYLPELIETIDDVEFHEIGHSSQNY